MFRTIKNRYFTPIPSSKGLLPILMGTILVFLLGLASSVMAANWLHFGHDNQFTSYNKDEKIINVQNIKKLRRIWGIGCDDGYFSTIFRSPAIYKGRLFTSGAGEQLTAYNALDGDFQWTFGKGNAGWAPQPVVSKDGIVFYLEDTYPTTLYAVRAATGEKLWTAPIALELGFEGAAYAVPVVDEAGNAVYVIENKFGDDGKLYAFDKENGKVLWYKSKAKDGVAFRGNYAVMKDSWIFATAVVGYSTDKLARINSKSGKIEMYYDRPGGYYDIGGCVICNGRLIVTYHDRDDVFRSKSILCAYDIDSPKVVWQKEYPNSAITGAVACNTDKNIIYVPTNPYLYAYHVETGKQVWRYTGFDAIFSPSVANGIIYFLSDTNLYAIKEANKKTLFTFPLGYQAEYSTQVAVANGMIYFSGDGGTCDLFALGLPAAKSDQE